jgi:hypothetical protein
MVDSSKVNKWKLSLQKGERPSLQLDHSLMTASGLHMCAFLRNPVFWTPEKAEASHRKRENHVKIET